MTKGRQLAAIVHQWVVQILNAEPWQSYIAGRMFQATVTDVSRFGLGVVTVTSLAGGGAHAGEWICAIPDYVPKVGDRVTIIREGPDLGYVAYPLVAPMAPYFKLRLSTAHSLTASTWNSVPFNQIVGDPWNAWSTSGNYWTAPAEGMYQVSFHLKSQPPGSQTGAQVQLWVNGSGTNGETCGDWVVPTTYYEGFSWSGLIHLDAGDELLLAVNPSATVALQVSDTPSAIQFSGFYVGRTK